MMFNLENSLRSKSKARRAPAGIALFLVAAWAVLGAEISDPSAAQTNQVILYLRGGDRVTGVITAEDTNRLVMTTRWSTVMVLPLTEILKREPLVPVSETKPAKPGAPLAASLTNSAVRPGTVAVSGPLPPIKPVLLRHLGGEAQVGVDMVVGQRNRQLYSGRLKATYTYNHFRNLFDYSFAYGRTDGLLSDNRMDGSSKSDFDLSKRFYVYNLGGAGYDEIRKIDVRYEIGPGLGLHAVKRTNFVLNTELGANYQAQYQTDDTKTELFFLRVAENSAWTLNHRMSVDEKFEFFPRVDDWEKYRFRFESNLRYALLANLAFVVTVLDQYDKQPAVTVTKNDLQLRSSISVKF